MSNSYVQFAVHIHRIKLHEREWFENILRERTDEEIGDEDGMEKWVKEMEPIFPKLDIEADFWPEVDYEFRAQCLILYSEESRNPDWTAYLLHEFLKKFRPDEYIMLEWAYTCDKRYSDEFGGGSAFITADKIRWNGTLDWLHKQKESWEKRRKKSA